MLKLALTRGAVRCQASFSLLVCLMLYYIDTYTHTNTHTHTHTLTLSHIPNITSYIMLYVYTLQSRLLFVAGLFESPAFTNSQPPPVGARAPTHSAKVQGWFDIDPDTDTEATQLTMTQVVR